MNEKINQLVNEIQTISESYERVAEATGENFNIFSVLKIETDEVTTHSRFIAELLNPDGAHGQKDDFLKLFIESFSNFEINTLETKVKTEHTTRNGRIDILLKDISNKVIAIENKIYAGEQKDQLFKYSKDFPNAEKKQIIYLTLYGSESNEESSKGIEYKTMSYENDIIKWLEECKRKAVDIPILRESISQYINLIKKITNQNLNKKMSKDIARRIIKDQDSFKAYKTLVQSKKEIFKIIVDEEIIPLLRYVEKKYDLELDLKNEFYKGKRYVGFSFTNNKLSTSNIKIFFEFEQKQHKNLVFGFKYLNKEKKNDFNDQNLNEKFKGVFGNYNFSDNSPCYKVYSGYNNWNKLDHIEKIKYGNFKEDFEDKIKKMLSIIEV